jgi:hypothetical protein
MKEIIDEQMVMDEKEQLAITRIQKFSKIAKIPSYMYPQIRDKECYVFNNLELYKSFN